jgi:hypothetical protein
MCLLASSPEEAHDLDRLLEQLEPLVRQRPAVAERVLVEILAGADAGQEAPRHHRGDGRRSLGDDRRMDADHRARDACADTDLLRRLRDAAERCPDERALSLGVDPGVVVVGDEAVRKAGSLCDRCLAHKLVRRVVFGRECEAEFRHI